jgi:hypothetical protein
VRRVIVLPNGKRCSLPTYCQSWRTLKTLDPEASVKGWEWYPCKARDVLHELREGLHDRINRHIPGFGRGRKWSTDYQTTLRREAQMVNDYAGRRLVYPQGRLGTPELQHRFQWLYDSDGLSIVLHNSRRRLI